MVSRKDGKGKEYGRPTVFLPLAIHNLFGGKGEGGRGSVGVLRQSVMTSALSILSCPVTCCQINRDR